MVVSAGPGDLELFTIKAVKALASAQVLLLDDLANPEIVELAPQARVIRVCKRGGCRSTPQAFICRLMRRYALQGLRVVRVKGGDALLFGRAGEEIGFLRRAGVGVQVINGVSAALLAHLPASTPRRHRAGHHTAGAATSPHPLGDLGMTAAALPPGLPTLLLVGDAVSEAAAACDDRGGAMVVQAVG
uniref:uroporphyrinogen-III C-methyltransferase n=1 Tax=Xanthomonas axonopodis TaxID=53413 RepID=UPI003D779EA9